MASKYTALNPKIYQWSGKFVRYKQNIVQKQNKSKLIRTIQLTGEEISDRINNFFVKYGHYAAMSICLKFAETAAKYTPPNMGRANIEQRFYHRPIQDLQRLAKGEYPPYHATKQDYQALRDGYKYRVLNTKKGHKKNDVYAYTRGINEAKRAAKIALRGLSRYSWGANINNWKQSFNKQVDAKLGPNQINVFRVQASTLPPIFQRLARKSPNITKYTWGTFDWKFYPNQSNVENINFTITNRLTQIEAYGRVAIKQGTMAAQKQAIAIFKGANVVSQYKGGQRTDNPNDPTLIAVSDLRQSLVRLFDDAGYLRGMQKLEFSAVGSHKGRKPQYIQNNITINLN